MKPVLTFRSILNFSVVLAAMVVSDAQAQTRTAPTRTVRSSEKIARASWTPTRSVTKSESAAPATSNSTAKLRPLIDAPVESPTARRAPRGTVRRVDHVSRGGVPMPPGDTVSIIDPPIHYDGPIPDDAMIPRDGAIYHEGPMDGQVVLSPIQGSAPGESVFGGSACDALPACGCGDSFCGGQCDSIGNCGNGSCGTSGCSMCGELASPNAWRPCVTLCLPQDGWFSAEYLLWYQDGLDLPPLVTTSRAGTQQSVAGVLGQGTTTTVFGGEVLDDTFDGLRLNFGVWLDRCHTWGLGGEYFEIGEETASFAAASTAGGGILGRPFFNVNPQTGVAREDAELVSFPGVVGGSINARATSELKGAGAHLRYLRDCNEGCTSGLFCGCPGHFCSRQEAMFGYRFLQLDESVVVNERLVADSTGPDAGTAFAISDVFETRNQFNGFDLGWMYRRTLGYWSFDSRIRMGIGNTKQTVRIAGNTLITETGQPNVSAATGILAQRTNIGVHEQDEFSVIPEFNANLGYQLTDHFRATIGYTFIYWSNIVRPGDHISRDLNPDLFAPEVPTANFTGADRPEFRFDTTDYWVQGLSIGGEYRW